MNGRLLLALAVLAALSVLTFRGLRKNADRAGQRRINKILALSGCGLLVVSVLWGTAACFRPGTSPSPAQAADTAEGFLLLVGPVFLAVLVPLLIRMAIGRKMKEKSSKGRAVRILLSLSGSAACLLLSALWSSVTAGSEPGLSPAFWLAGFSLSLILRLPLVSEYRA